MDDIFEPLDIETNETPEDPYEALVGEGKKYADNSALAKAALEKDRFIAKLQQEAAELRQEVTSKATIDEILTQIKATQAPGQSTPQEPQKPQTPETPDIEKLVSSLLEQKESEKKVSQNEALVHDKLREKFGNDASLHINKKARELGVSVEYLKDLARKSPSVFFKVTDLDKAPPEAPAPTAPRSRITPEAKSAGTRDKAYYERLKTQDRMAYFSEKTQLQMYKDMKAVLEAGGQW